MATSRNSYPRGSVRKIVKAHSDCILSKTADALIFLDYALFLQTLMKEAVIDAREAAEPKISATSVKHVTEKSLAKFKG
ncbi:hypothetical protein K3495_g344 [Podosphaera aphanis]|nr:hypothetical protein K3495_g344 [Podosphaera aphanis]